MTLDGYAGTVRILVSYDVAGEARSKAARVCQIVFGRVRTTANPARSRKTNGFIHRPGVVWIGQSVLAMPPSDAAELRDRLAAIGVRLAVARIEVSQEALEAFRRPARPMA